jgi:hypothetical protein
MGDDRDDSLLDVSKSPSARGKIGCEFKLEFKSVVVFWISRL